MTIPVPPTDIAKVRQDINIFVGNLMLSSVKLLALLNNTTVEGVTLATEQTEALKAELKVSYTGSLKDAFNAIKQAVNNIP